MTPYLIYHILFWLNIGISFNTVLDLRKNALRQLDENVFRPLIGKLIRGSGFIQLSGKYEWTSNWHLYYSSIIWVLQVTT